MAPSKVISIRECTKLYNEVSGVRDISLDVLQGEIFGFLGPNGAGKTTTIRLMLDLLRPASGSIEIFGMPLRKNSYGIRKRCGYLPGDFNAYLNLSGLEFLRFCAGIRKAPRDPDPLLLDRFELTGNEMERKIKYLSHGTVQKLGLIQAFHHHPELLILDEPTSGLDPLMQEEFYKLLKERQDEGATVFVSSHNLAEVDKICDRTAIVRKGRIAMLDAVGNLRDKLVKTLKLTLATEIPGLSLPGATLIRKRGLTWEFAISGDIREVLKALAGLPVTDLFIPEPGLDDIFLNYYKGIADD